MGDAKNYGVLTHDQLFHLGRHAMDNGAQLSKEARLLLDNGHHARAFGLAVLALEEAGKAFMCAQWAGRKPIPTNKAEWQEFWNHFKDHIPKYVRALHYEWPAELGWTDDDLKELERLAREHKQYKEWCFYVGHDGKSVSDPLKIDPVPCREHVEQVEGFFSRVLKS